MFGEDMNKTLVACSFDSQCSSSSSVCVVYYCREQTSFASVDVDTETTVNRPVSRTTVPGVYVT